jgi:predicted RNase H-like HicB family nuclease
MTVAELVGRDYPIALAVERQEDGTEQYAAWLFDFPGCIAQGRTEQDAIDALEALKPLYFEQLLATGAPIAEPSYPPIIPGRIAWYDARSGGTLIKSMGRKSGVKAAVLTAMHSFKSLQPA